MPHSFSKGNYTHNESLRLTELPVIETYIWFFTELHFKGNAYMKESLMLVTPAKPT